jgi:hypothetical protein
MKARDEYAPVYVRRRDPVGPKRKFAATTPPGPTQVVYGVPEHLV